MSEGRFHIRSSKFPVMDGEDEEVVNPRTFGKSLAHYLSEKLKTRGYRVPSYFSEDFGWWIEIIPPQGSSHIALRRAQDEPQGLADFAISVSSDKRKWSWRWLKFVEMESFNRQLSVDVESILQEDAEIEIVARDFENYPDDRINPNAMTLDSTADNGRI